MALLSNVISMEAPELKNLLKEIQLGGKIREKKEKLFLVKSMIEHIGSPDRELRDDLIYGTFYKLILEKQLDQQLLIEILTLGLSDRMLFKGIGETGTDAVFTRSFTTLLIALILNRNNEEDFLSRNMIAIVKDNLITYIQLENDLRGFVPGKGWAHSIAHIADAFDELVKNKNITQDMYLEILISLWDKVFVSDAIYIHDEEERLLVPMLEMLNRGMVHETIEGFIDAIPTELAKQKILLKEERYWVLYANSKKFLKSFYMQIENHPNLSSFQKGIKTITLTM